MTSFVSRRLGRNRNQTPPEAPKAPTRTTAMHPIVTRVLLLGALALAGFGATYAVVVSWPSTPRSSDPPDMLWIPGGEFTMGSDAPDASSHERPAHRVRVDGFWIDETDVTNAQFRRFVEATGYVTTAEKPPTVEDILRYSR